MAQPTNNAEKGAPRRRRPGLFRRVAGWSVCLALLAPAGSWIIGDRAWALDIGANLAFQTALLALVIGLWRLLRRRWGQAAVALGACALALAPLPHGRAERAGPSEGPTLVLLTWNSHVDNARPEESLRTILESGADVITLYESSDELLELMRASVALHEAYPDARIPVRAGAGFRVLLSAWPARRVPRPREEVAAGDPAHGATWRIAHPDGPEFLVSMIHPASPRTPQRWRDGDDDIRRLLDAAHGRLGALDLPTIYVGDLNTTPTGARSRRMTREAGLLRAKPMLAPVGTWPAWAPWPARVAIDDAMLTPEIRVVSWEALPASGSDHLPVRMTLSLPPPDRR